VCAKQWLRRDNWAYVYGVTSIGQDLVR
jgi:hypothetical protein